MLDDLGQKLDDLDES